MGESSAPPPWRLRGDGWVIFYNFQRDFALRWTPPELRERFHGGIGAVAFVNYTKSPVGAYRELMFIPGRLRVRRKNRLSITQIYVSTYASVIGGRENWGIPKEHASFNVDIGADGVDTLTATTDIGDLLAEFKLRPGVLKLPLPTSRLTPLQLVQWREGKQYQTHFWGWGGLSLVDVQEIHVNGDKFPDVSGQKPLGAIKISDFRLTFGVPKVTSA